MIRFYRVTVPLYTTLPWALALGCHVGATQVGAIHDHTVPPYRGGDTAQHDVTRLITAYRCTKYRLLTRKSYAVLYLLRTTLDLYRTVWYQVEIPSFIQ